MVKRLNKTVAGAVIGLFLVGCSLLTVRPAEFEAIPSKGIAANDLRPGLTPVMVDRIHDDHATIHWRSEWKGKTTIYYGTTPVLVPFSVDKTTPTYEHMVKLDQLKPSTRYYFQIETETPLGDAHSPVLSFRTP